MALTWQFRPFRRETSRRGCQGRRYTDRQRIESLKLIAAGMSRQQVAATIGATVETLRLWVKKAEAQGTMPAAMVAAATGGVPGRPALETPTEDDTEQPSPFVARDPGQGLAPAEEDVGEAEEGDRPVAQRHEGRGGDAEMLAEANERAREAAGEIAEKYLAELESVR